MEILDRYVSSMLIKGTIKIGLSERKRAKKKQRDRRGKKIPQRES